jgi:putative nucleotidyltransferase with HDIG domain
MQEKTADPTIAHQIELIIHRLEQLSTLPSIATRLLLSVSQPEVSTTAETVESDPALAAAIFSLIHQQRLSSAGEFLTAGRAINKLPAYAIRQAILSIKIYPAFGGDEHRILFRKQLVRHCLAVACCAAEIAEIISPKMDSQLCYSAGLLHDIGKLALDEAMPRSFAGIVEQAQSQQLSTLTIEQKHLGLDHTILGKRLAAKWHLPKQIMLAIWLHHSNVPIISQNVPDAKIAQVVQLADLIARQCGIGQSGSFDTPDLTDKTAQELAISPSQLEQIRRHLEEKVAQKSEILGLDSPVTADEYCNALRSAYSQVAQKQSELTLENRRLQTALSHFEFAREFLLSIDSNAEPIDAAENFAVRWQKFYQTGSVCLYLATPGDQEFLNAVVLQSPTQTKTVILRAPAEMQVFDSFAILNAGEYADWLFEQLDIEFDLGHTKLVPLISGGKNLGALVFELHYPVETDQFEENLKISASIAAAVLDLSFAATNQRQLSEQFVQSLTAAPPDPALTLLAEASKADALDALAEMAAGAAHELNNPLSVISGRAQLLATHESEPTKLQGLKQIQQNAGEISTIIDDLMAFANPPKPHPSRTAHRQLLDEAIQLASQKTGTEHIDVRIEVAGDVKSVFVDSAQVASALANVITNSIESYADSTSMVKITASADKGDFVRLTITDLGCGMDAETIQKATWPFFSNQPAGRKRGMGLAHAARLIQLNGGRLSITSSPNCGTTVTILLPCKSGFNPPQAD